MRSSAAYFTLSLAAMAFFSAAVVLSVRCAPLLFRARSLKLHRDGGRARAPETHRWLLRAHQNCPSCSSGKFGHFDFFMHARCCWDSSGERISTHLECLSATKATSRREFLFSKTRLHTIFHLPPAVKFVHKIIFCCLSVYSDGARLKWN